MQSEDDSRCNKLTACKPPNHVNHFVNQFSLDAATWRALTTFRKLYREIGLRTLNVHAADTVERMRG
jgi:hypothetical protein